jgi:Flp pilus assembly protein TadG
MPRRLRKTTKGQALVEFALAATLIFFLLAAVVDLGLIFFTVQGLHNAAQEGATYGSRWLNASGTGLDYAGIRNRARMEAGNRAGFANLLDLNNNGTNDMSEDSANIGAASGTSLFPTYIDVRALADVDGNGDPTNDGTAPNYTPCTSVTSVGQLCYLRVVVSMEYRMLFPLAPGFARQTRLRSQYIIPMRSGFQQAGP